MLRLRRPAAALVVLLTLWPSLVSGQASKAGVVTTLEGNVTVARTALPQPAPLKFKDDVFVNDKVTTGDRSGATAVPAGAGAAIVRAQISRLEAECAEAGRDPQTLRRMVLSGAELDAGLASRDAFEDTLGRYAEAGVTDFVVHWPRANAPYAGDVARFEELVGDQLSDRRMR